MQPSPQSPVGVVKPLNQPASVCQSDLNVGGGLGGVQAHGGAGLSLVSSLVLLGGGWSCGQLWGGTRGENEQKEKKERKKR